MSKFQIEIRDAVPDWFESGCIELLREYQRSPEFDWRTISDASQYVSAAMSVFKQALELKVTEQRIDDTRERIRSGTARRPTKRFKISGSEPYRA